MTFEPAELQTALAHLEALPEPARENVRRAVSMIVELHGAALRRLILGLREARPDIDGVLTALASDEAIAGVFSVHGLHPVPLTARVETALARARELERTAHVELVSIDRASIRVRVFGSERLRREVGRRIEEAAPEVERVEVLAGDPDLVPLGKLVAGRQPRREACDLCSGSLAAEHDHLFDVRRRKLQCTCAACAILFDKPGLPIRRVRGEARRLEDFQISDAVWGALEVPVGVAFFSRSSAIGEVIAGYPGPLGVIESTVPSAAWRELAALNPVLAELDEDVSALFADRVNAPASYHLVSIDQCYRLTALMQSRWRGLTGGDEARRAVAEFFTKRTEACR